MSTTRKSPRKVLRLAYATAKDALPEYALANRSEEFDRRFHDLCGRHAGKPSLLRRLRDAGLAR